MSDFYKKLLGFLTAWPFAWMVLFFLFVIGLLASGPGGDLDPIGGLMFLIFVLIHILTVLLAIGLQVFYIVNVFKNDQVKKEHQVAWVLALFFGGLLAMPIYWYVNIWKESSDDHSPHRTLSSGDSFETADQSQWETRTGDPVPPEPHSWR